MRAIFAAFLFLHVVVSDIPKTLRSNALQQKACLLRLRGSGFSEEEDPIVKAKLVGDVNSGAGRRVLSKRLRQASEKGKVLEMRSALEDGADPKAVDLAGFTSLHLAAENGHIEASALLLEKVGRR